MFSRKKVRLFLVLAIALLVIPHVFGLFEGLYSGFYGGFWNPIDSYVNDNGFMRTLIHFVIFLMLFTKVSEFFVVQHYGEKAKESKLPAALGLIGSISLTSLFYS